MIRLSDAAILAYTKLRTRKIRTGITVGVSGILFGALLFVLIVIGGVERSVNSFSEEGLGKRYITSIADFGSYSGDLGNLYENKEVIARAKVLHKEVVEEKKKEAARLKIEYSPESEPEPADKQPDGKEYLSLGSEGSRRAVDEYLKAHPEKDSFTNIKKTLAPYHPKQYFVANAVSPQDGALQTMKNGREKFVEEKKDDAVGYFMNTYEEADDPVAASLQTMDGSLTAPFLLKKMLWKPAGGEIPVIVTYNSAEKLLGLKKLPSDATAKQKMERISEVRDKAGALTFDVCYRNTTSKGLIDASVAAQKEMDKNKGKKDYQKPSLIYGLPSPESCGAVPVTSDTRTKAEKTYDENQKIFDRKFNGYQNPRQEKIKFQVVGLSPGVSSSLGSTGDIVSMLMSSSLGGSWAIPRDMYEKLPIERQYKDILFAQKTARPYLANNQTEAYYAEFANAEDARAAIKKHACNFAGCPQSAIYITQFGSGSIAVADMKDMMRQAFVIGALVIAAIAMLIMAGTIGRMIADGRRETAVFRAIGAKRSDISMIYLVYTLLLGLRVVIFALILGLIGALLLDYFISPDATATAQLMFGASDLDRQFHFYGLMSVELLYVIGLIFLTGLISMILPLLRNIRRNPINDMRDE